MRKKLIALAVAGAMDSPIIAQADVSIYHNYPLENRLRFYTQRVGDGVHSKSL